MCSVGFKVQPKVARSGLRSNRRHLPGREPIIFERLGDARFGAHSGLNQDIAALPKSANNGNNSLYRGVRRALATDLQA
jgi:hypothetical protein